MIERPERYLEDFAKAGAYSIVVHVEACADAAATLRRIRELGCHSGIALRPATALREIEPFLSLADIVLVMTVNPGFSGQSFMADAAEKVAKARAALERIGNRALIEVDGGVNAETAAQVRDADVLVAGNYVFKSQDYAAAISRLKAVKAG
jgi:ribulose-phosphate 3-epimerase